MNRNSLINSIKKTLIITPLVLGGWFLGSYLKSIEDPKQKVEKNYPILDSKLEQKITDSITIDDSDFILLSSEDLEEIIIKDKIVTKLRNCVRGSYVRIYKNNNSYFYNHIFIIIMPV